MKLKPSFSAPLLVLFIYIALIALDFIDYGSMEKDGVYLSLIVLQLLIFIIPGIIFCRLRGVGYSLKLNIKPFAPGKLGFILLCAMTLACGTMIIRFAQVYAAGITDFTFTLYDTYLPEDMKDVGSILYVVITFAAIPAICEEFVFRGIMLTEYNEGGFGAVTSAVITSIMFAMLHFSLERLPMYFFGGIILAFAVYTTGSVLASMIIHFLYNLYGLFAEGYILTVIRNPENTFFFIFMVSVLFLMFMIMTVGEAERINYRNAVNGAETPKYIQKRQQTDSGAMSLQRLKLLAEAFFSPSFLLCILVFVIITFGFIIIG